MLRPPINTSRQNRNLQPVIGPRYDANNQLQQTFTDPEGRVHTYNPRNNMYEVSGFVGTEAQRNAMAKERENAELEAAQGRVTSGKIGQEETKFQQAMRSLRGQREQANLGYASGARAARRAGTAAAKQAGGAMAEGGGGVTRSPAMQTYRDDIVKNTALNVAAQAQQRAGILQGLSQQEIDLTIAKENNILNILIDAAAAGDARAAAVLERKLAQIQQAAGMIGGQQ